MIRTRDHEPAHVHVVGPDRQVKIAIETLDVIENNGFSNKDLKLILKYLSSRKEQLIEKWEEIHGE